jgi:hemoglobin-like flavoprotein
VLWQNVGVNHALILKPTMSLNVELLEQSFEQIKPNLEEFISSFYLTLFHDSPQIGHLFDHTDMAKQRKMMFGALTLVMENLRNPEALDSALKGLGARHVQYGALPQYYPLFGRSLLKAMANSLGKDWTPELQQAWVEAYTALTSLMLEGAEYPETVTQMDMIER